MAAVSAVTPSTLLRASTNQDAERAADVAWTKAPCRLCGVGCGLLIGVENGRAVAVKGDPDSPVSKGLACAKGYYAVQALYGRDRITRALIRRNGALVEAPIGEALDLVAQRMREALARHGKDSVAVYGSAQWTIPDAYVASKFFKGALGSNNVETSARLYAASMQAGAHGTFGLDGAAGCYEDIEHADVFVLWDINLAETDPVLFSRILARRRADPAVRIIDLATRTTRTSYGADYSVLCTPQSAVAVANAICHEVIVRGWADREFVDRHVAFKRGRTGLGYGVSGEMVVADEAAPATWDDCVKFFETATPEQAQGMTGVTPANTRWLASLYGDRSRKVLSVWGANANQHARGTWTNNALYNLHLLTGKIGSPGNGALALSGQPNGGSAVHEAGASADALPRGVVSGEEDRRRAAGIWGVPVEHINPRPGPTALSMFRALDRGDITFMWIQATNPMVSLPNLNRYRRAAARRDDRFIVVTEAYPTPTTEIADVVLPAAMWIEREGMYANAERRVQHFDQAIEPPGDAASDAWHMIEVARRLGHAKLFPWSRREHGGQIWEEYRRFYDDSQTRIPPLATLRERPGVMWPLVNGRETLWRYNAQHDPSARAQGAFDFYGHADHRAWIWLHAYEPPAESPNADHPFWLTTGPVLEQWGGGAMTQRIPTLHRAMPGAYVEMNRADARRLGIQNGEAVRLSNARGALTLVARIDFRSQPAPGRLFVPTFDATLPVKRLLLDASDPASGQPDATTCAVRVERIPAEKAP